MNTTAKKRLELQLSRTLSAVLISIVALMPVHAFLSTWLGTSIGPLLVWKSWKELLLLAVVPVAIWYLALRPDITRTIWARPLTKTIAVYALLHLGLSIASTISAQAIIAGLMFNLRFLAIFMLAQIIAEAHTPLLKKIRERFPRWLMAVAIGLGVLAILQVFALPKDFLVQFGYDQNATISPYILVDQNPNALRAFATMRGPNALGAYLLLPLAIALYFVWKNRRDYLAWAGLVFGILAIGLTGSRSAWLGAIVTGVTLVVLLVPRTHIARWAKLSILPALFIVGVIGWGAVNVPAIRLAVFHSSPGDSSLNEGSNDKHWEATAQGITDVVRHPWGSGPGSAGPASFYNASSSQLSENYYVQIAQEVGVVGLGLFITICILTIKNIVRRRPDVLSISLIASFVGISLINIFLHGWADDPLALTWWALAGLYIGKK